MSYKKKEFSKEERIKKELKRLTKIYKNIPEKSKKSIEGLLENSAFMRITLQDLALDLRENGLTEKFSQSDKTEPYDRTRPNADLYNKINVNYQKIIKQLTDLLPSSEKEAQATDDFDDFVIDRREI